MWNHQLPVWEALGKGLSGPLWLLALLPLMTAGLIRTAPEFLALSPEQLSLGGRTGKRPPSKSLGHLKHLMLGWEQQGPLVSLRDTTAAPSMGAQPANQPETQAQGGGATE